MSLFYAVEHEERTNLQYRRKTVRRERHFSIILQTKSRSRRCCSINRHRRSCLNLVERFFEEPLGQFWPFDGPRHRVNWESLDRRAEKVRKERWM